VLTPELAAAIAERKPEIITHLGLAAAPMAAAPATFAQERLWFLDRLEGNPAHYNQAQAALLEGPLDTTALFAAFEAVIARHAALRSHFRSSGGRVEMAAGPAAALPHDITDLSGAVDPLAAASEWVSGLATKSFDLAAGPLLRVALARLGDQRHVLSVVMHHIICDGWSTGILFHELSTLYGGAPLPPLPIDVLAAATRERARRGAAALAASVAWWRQELAGAPPALALPTDRSPPALRSFAGSRVAFALTTADVRALERLGHACGASLFMTLLAIHGLLLGRHADTDDLVIGTPVADRREPDVEGLIGHFLNTLALRIRLTGSPTLRQLIARVRDTVLDAFAHGDLPFGHLVQALNPARDLGRAPIAQSFFILHNTPRPALALRGLSVIMLPEAPVWCDYLTLSLAPDAAGGGLAGQLDYSCDLFDRETAGRLAQRFVHLVRSALADPDRTVDELALEPPAPAMAVTTPPALPLLPASLREQAARTPDAVAIAAGNETVTYGALDAQSDRIAWRLNALGIGPGDGVGIALARTPKLLAGLIGVLKAGAAYVPLDPAFPAERRAAMAADAGLAALLVESEDRDLSDIACPRLVADGILADRTIPRTELPRAPAPSDPAYLLYTSGSTGRPKGVVVPHLALAHVLQSLGPLLGLTSQDRFLAVTTISFDIAALELFLPLITGIRLVLADRATAADGRALARLISASGATVMQATPTTWRLLLQAGWRGKPGFRVLAGGEALPADLAGALAADGAELWNLYGPTETTIWSTAHRVTSADLAPDAEPVVPIGRPIGDTLIRIADRAGRALPDGVPGELLIGGPGLAEGYQRRPELTAERFVSIDGLRFYRTGDRALQRRDGTLLFRGRNDDQIKLNGFRIEPGEIEIALTALGARQAVILRRETRPGDARLVAYLVAGEGPLPDAADLRAMLARTLPDYMIPTAFVVLPGLPLTANGKIDRAALPEPAAVAGPTGASPVTAAEQAVAAIFESVLDRRPISRHDNFFALGGHSLLTLTAQEKLEAQFGRPFEVATLFRHPTVASLAEFAMGGTAALAPDGADGAARRLRAGAAEQRRRRALLAEQHHD
jgi:amino acid adenylation domain-containing protein